MGQTPFSDYDALRPAMDVGRLTATTPVTGISQKLINVIARDIRASEPADMKAVTSMEDYRKATAYSLYAFVALVEIWGHRREPQHVGPLPKKAALILSQMRSTVEISQGREVRRKLSCTPDFRAYLIKALGIDESLLDEGAFPTDVVGRARLIDTIGNSVKDYWDSVSHQPGEMVNLAEDGEPLILYGAVDDDEHIVYSRPGLTNGHLKIIQALRLDGPARTMYGNGLDAVRYNALLESESS